MAHDKLNQLIELEQSIKEAWLKEGLALWQIRNQRLYQARDFKTFGAYYREHLELSKQVVSKRIASAITATRLIKHQETLDASQATYHRLSKIPEDKQQSAFDQACKNAVSDGSNRVTAKHVDQAIIEIMGGYAPEVLKTCDRWGITDTEKKNILQTWFDRSKDSDSKFWSVFHSGVVDPGDDLPPCDFATATITEIADVAERWKKMRMAAETGFTPIIGIVNKAELMIDGMMIATDEWKGKRVQITVKVLKYETV